ncbi:MAG: hypothetical protein GY704_12250, partial [Phycisphaeraceae bacterium]|nr:hypothetical protein [Phycisphaeraceae bacterium]
MRYRGLPILCRILGLGALLALCGGSPVRGDDSVTIGEPVRVPVTPASGYHLEWSPDSTTIAFARWIEGRGTAWTVPVSGGEATRLPIEMSGDFYLSWNPEGTHLAFDAYNPGTSGPNALWTIPVAGGGPTRISSRAANAPTWSPNGDRIAFVMHGTSLDIYSVTLDGGNLRRHTYDSSEDFHPDWSPDGTHLAFTSERSGNRDIWIRPIGTGPAVQITTDPEHDDRCCWAPNGAWIAFVSDRSGSRNIWLKPVAGGDAVQVTDRADSPSMPTWSPDGRHLMFGTMDDSGVWTVRIDFPTAV